MVGVLRIELFLPSCHSLKEKRSIVKSLTKQIRNKFNVSVSEMDYLEQWQRTGIGIAAVANEMSFLQRELDTVVRFVENTPDAELISVNAEYYD